jgi:hypothetical protein
MDFEKVSLNKQTNEFKKGFEDYTKVCFVAGCLMLGRERGNPLTQEQNQALDRMLAHPLGALRVANVIEAIKAVENRGACQLCKNKFKTVKMHIEHKPDGDIRTYYYGICATCLQQSDLNEKIAKSVQTLKNESVN